MDRLFRSNSSVRSRSSIPPNIINEEDYSFEETNFIYLKKWCIPKIDTKSIYKTSWVQSTFNSEFNVITVEQTYSISKTHEKCCLFDRKCINDFLTKRFSFLHIGLGQVAVKPLTQKGINASVLMCLRDSRFKNFHTSILGMITSSLFDGPIYFSCYHDLTLALDDPNIVKAFTLNILTSGYDMDEGSKPLAIIYCIYYRLLKTILNPHARLKNIGEKTLFNQCSTPNAKVQIPRMICWKYITLPKEWLLEQEAQPVKFASDELNLDHIQQ